MMGKRDKHKLAAIATKKTSTPAPETCSGDFLGSMPFDRNGEDDDGDDIGVDLPLFAPPAAWIIR